MEKLIQISTHSDEGYITIYGITNYGRIFKGFVKPYDASDNFTWVEINEPDFYGLGGENE